jgi:hypothetical protein
MIRDTKTSDALPLLAFTLRELYEGFGEDKLLTLEEYCDKLGRLDGCIARAAEAVLGAKPVSEIEALDLRAALLCMIRMNGQDQYVKQPVLWKDLPASIHDVLERFVTGRLLISSGNEKGRTLEVAHEAIFLSWPRLATWIEEDGEDLFVLRRAEVEAGEWKRHGYDLKYLWHPDRLKKLKEIVERRGDKSEIVRLFMAPQEKLLPRLWDPSLSHQARLIIGNSLAAIGDTRPGVGLDQDGLPDIMWIDIPPGKVNMFPKINFWRTTVNPFRISKYPVTNVQFEAFLKADDGYCNNEWWRGIRYIITQLWPLGEPHESARPLWPEANCPRENVSWYEAVAFCRWLSTKTRTNIRLPTVKEWMLAMTGGDPSHQYPWEGGWDGTRCNSYDSELNRTTAVGMYPAGATQQGAEDMVGNVWEWCQNRIFTTRVILGRCFSIRPEYPLGMEGVNKPASKSNYVGFRLTQDIGS